MFNNVGFLKKRCSSSTVSLARQKIPEKFLTTLEVGEFLSDTRKTNGGHGHTEHPNIPIGLKPEIRKCLKAMIFRALHFVFGSVGLIWVNIYLHSGDRQGCTPNYQRTPKCEIPEL